MQQYYCSTFSIQLNNETNILQKFKNVYLHIQKSDGQNMFSSIKKRESTSILFYNEEGFTFNEEELLRNQITVQIHEYLMDSQDQEDKTQKQDCFQQNKDSLIGISSVTINQLSTSIYSSSQPNIVIGELMYTLKPFVQNQMSSQTDIMSLISIHPFNDDRYNTLLVDRNNQLSSNNSNKQLSSKVLSFATSLHEACKGADTNDSSNNTTNNQQKKKKLNQVTNSSDNLVFFKLLNPYNQQYNQQQYNCLNEEESTETPTSKLISSQGDLNSSHQDEQNQPLSKSASQSLHLNESERQKTKFNKVLMGQKLKQIFEINSPIDSIKKQNPQQENNSPTNKRLNISCKENNQQQQQQQSSEIQQQKPQSIQQKSTFTQCQNTPQSQQENNPINSIKGLNKLPTQNLNQYQQSPVFSPASQQQLANKLISPFQTNISQFAHPSQNRIHAYQYQNNMIYQNNQGLAFNQNFNTPQHRFVQQQQPSFYQPIQNQPVPSHRNSTMTGTPMRLATTQFPIHKRF